MTKNHPPIRFGIIGINHDHIYGMVHTLVEAGAELVLFYTKEPELAARFQAKYPNVPLVRTPAEILDDERIQVIASSAIPNERAPLGIEAMQRIPCDDVELPFGRRFLADVINRTETAMPQAHCFLASELALKAQAQAARLGNLADDSV